ncbi:MAG: tRNA pseudouridine(38-40) synthase TruA, partial [Clostridia bacterium]|nr:tRNA pseudouridine(38-40) synthase TruA [Clostridia bacterium]
GTLNFEINANAYLYNMVRIISGTLLYVGCGKIKANDIPHIIESTDRTKAGITAPPEGLYLKEIFYE